MRAGCHKRQGREKVLAKTRGEQAVEKPVPKKTGVGEGIGEFKEENL